MAEESITTQQCQTCFGDKRVVSKAYAGFEDCPDCQGTGKTTQQQETERLEYLARLECPNLPHNNYISEGADNDYKTRVDCDCQGTGLRLPGLSRECHGIQNGPEPEGVHRGCGCHGTGRIPVSVETGFLWLVGQKEFACIGGGTVTGETSACWAGYWEYGPTAPLVLFAAVRAAVEAEV